MSWREIEQSGNHDIDVAERQLGIELVCVSDRRWPRGRPEGINKLASFRSLKSRGQVGAQANVCFRRAPLAFSAVGVELRENIAQLNTLANTCLLVFEAGYK